MRTRAKMTTMLKSQKIDLNLMLNTPIIGESLDEQEKGVNKSNGS